MPSESRIDSSSNSMDGGPHGPAARRDHDRARIDTCRRPSHEVIATVFASRKRAAPSKIVNVVARELVADDVRLAMLTSADARAQVVHRDVVLDAIALPVDRPLHEAGQVEHRLAQRLGRDRPAEDAAAAELLVLDDGAAAAELGGLDRGLLTRRPAADRQEVEMRRRARPAAKRSREPVVWRISPKNSLPSGERSQ